MNNSKSNNKIKLIYIASNGRSGSTLLEMMLSAHPEIETLGEFQRLFIDHRFYGTPLQNELGAQVCGCGKDLKECDFWSSIINKFKTNDDVELFNYFRSAPHVQGKALRFTNLKDIFWNKISKENIGLINQYNKFNFQVLNEIQEKISIGKVQPYLIDSSKDIYRLAWLSHSNEIDIKVIHVIKECPAFAYSMIKKTYGLARFLLLLRKISRWFVENSLIKLVCRKCFTPEDYFEMKYEDLATNPKQTMDEIMNWLNLPKNDSMIINFRHLQHGVSGNQMRHEDKPITLDNTWKYELPVIYKYLANSVQYIYDKQVKGL